MSKKLSILLACLLAMSLVAFVGCGSSDDPDPEKKLEDYIPATDDIAGWTEDIGHGEVGVEAAYTQDEGEMLIDGALDPFVDTGKWAALAIEYYVNGETSIQLSVFEMTDTAGVSEVYAYLATHPEGINWTDTTLGEQGRIAEMATNWLIQTTKGKYFVETVTMPRSPETEQPAKDFASAVLALLP